MDPRAINGDTATASLISIVVPVRHEAQNVLPLFKALSDAVHVRSEILVVYDSGDDPTVPVAQQVASSLSFPVQLVKNSIGPGPANALRAGFAAARGEAIVVVMADLSDDVTMINRMVAQFTEGSDLVCAARYARGGQQIGGPWLKRVMSRFAGLSLHAIVGLPTHDPTNNFKLYRTERLRSIQIESSQGFEIGLEITVKAWRAGWKITELPSRWVDRTAGKSKFKLWRWLPRYLRWYAFALGFGT